MPLGKLTPAEVRRWHSDRLANTGPVRTRQAYSLLRTILGTAVKDELLASNPSSIRGAGQARSPKRPFVSRDQADAQAAALPADMRVLLVVTLWAHLRVGELLALRRGDVSLADGTVHVHRQMVELKTGTLESSTKTGRGRIVHLPTQALVELQRHMAATGPALPSARLFMYHSGRPLQRYHLNAAWSRARKQVGLPDVHWHDLRHAGLTYVAMTGASLREIMERGGHSTVAAAMTYQHLADSRDEAIAASLSDTPPKVRDQGQMGS